MRILVCGGRDYANKTFLFEVLDNFSPKPTLIINGAARGADILSSQWAAARGVELAIFPADWKKGKGAGMIRNKQMIVEGKPDFVIAFPGGAGTANMISQAKKAGIAYCEIEDDSPVETDEDSEENTKHPWE